MVQGNAAAAQGVLIRLLQIGFATGSLVALGILLLQVLTSNSMFQSLLLPSAAAILHKFMDTETMELHSPCHAPRLFAGANRTR